MSQTGSDGQAVDQNLMSHGEGRNAADGTIIEGESINMGEEPMRADQPRGVSADEADAGIYNDEGEGDDDDEGGHHRAYSQTADGALSSLQTSGDDGNAAQSDQAKQDREEEEQQLRERQNEQYTHAPPVSEEYRNTSNNACRESDEAKTVPPMPTTQRKSTETMMQVTRTRPTTADKIRMRTARLMHELAEIDKFRELRTVTKSTSPSDLTVGAAASSSLAANRSGFRSASKSNGAKSVSSPKSSSSSSPSSLPPIKGARAGGLFSETLAQSRHGGTILAAATGQAPSRTGTAANATIGGPSGQQRSQTRGDGRAGFISRESGIADLVQQLTNKWGR